MKSECLPVSQIPHATRLFTDFLSYAPSVRPFYPRSAYFQEWMQQETSNVRHEGGRRAQVSAVLERQNRQWGASAKAMDNIGRLRNGAYVVVTGQQVGLFGGPLFSIFKALTALKLATVARSAGIDCVPVFWLATEDHDFAEVNHIAIPNTRGTLERLELPTRTLSEVPVGSIQFDPEIDPLVETAASLLGDSEVTAMLRDAYRQGETPGSALARLFAALFADWGVILLDASDPELHAVAGPIYRAAIERTLEIDDALLQRGRELETAGYHQQVRVTPSSTLLFTISDGVRTPIHRRINGNRETEFLIGEQKISERELVDQIVEFPQRFSANVLLRPVVQDFLLPTIAYTGGAAEIAYFAQAGVVYQALLGRSTPVVPRFTATLIEAKPQRLLDRYGLKLPDLFHGPARLREELANKTLPADLQAAFDRATTGLESSLAAIREGLSKLDATLGDAAARAGGKMHYQLEHLRASAARAELRQSELLTRHAELLSSLLYPDKALQERAVAGVYFLARHGLGLLEELFDAVHADCFDHQVIQLD